MKHLMLLSLLFSFTAIADTETAISDELALADEAIQSPTMNIEGKYHAPVAVPTPIKEEKIKIAPTRKTTASDRLRLIRQRLEERNRIMVEKKMEQIRFQQELALAKQLEKSMNQTLKSIDNVQ